MVALLSKDAHGYFRDRKKAAIIFGPLPLSILVIVLCVASFYLGEIYSERNVDASKASTAVSLLQNGAQPLKLEECDITNQDATPCTDPSRWRKYDRQRMAFRERHCPPKSQKLQCLIPPPAGYKVPIEWPKSKDQCWYKNVPYEWILNEKANQHWLKKEGDKFIFPGGGTMFPNGVDEYIDQMEELIPGLKDGTVRTALDTGCGVASWGGNLLERGVITMSLAPRDNHEAQVQFALERGIPAMLGIISTQRLPYPSRGFDLAHCSRCLIPWTDYGGVFLLEINRVLRPGGFWVLSGPPVNYEIHWHGWDTTLEKQKADMDAIQDLMAKMCYTQYAMKGDLAVWQKPLNNTCYKAREDKMDPPLCDDSVEPDCAWYTPMRTCIEPLPEKEKLPPKWPQRVTAAPDRVKGIVGGSTGAFKMDTHLWVNRVKQYRKLLPDLGTSKIRNVMDMNTKYGGFAAALNDDPVWVMNVVSSYATNTLGVVYDRGLIGSYNDWCEAFSTYPRTYDLLHSDNLLTTEGHRCEIQFIMLEMDRILRPKGKVIMRESPDVIKHVAAMAATLRWDCEQHEAEEESGEAEDAILVCQKQLWKWHGPSKSARKEAVSKEA